ncbi:MAG: hypothetical protein KKB20_11455 [Proteobacteria bacterium]|nr:hypothetical protein [Pseudomonadota bacterium]
MEYLRAGRLLRVDLTRRRATIEPTAPHASLLGGKGINLKLLFEGTGADTDPLGPENRLLFGAGPLVGTPFPAACRTDVMGKSPVTGHYGNSGLGGYLGAELKFAGYDNLVIEGRADAPVYLSIRDDRVEIRDAAALWGLDTYETPVRVREDLGDPGAQVVCIGPAGENLVIYASIMSGTGNAAARTGLGAVMGSKNLKAIAVRGGRGVAVARPLEFLQACRGLLESIREAMIYEQMHQIGITRVHDREMRGLYELLGQTWEGQETIREEAFMQEHIERRVGCFACPLACFDGYKISGAGTGTAKCSPYGDLTWDLRNNDLMVFWRVYVDCQRFGLDSRALSNILAWLMTVHEHGLITSSQTDGLEMAWGSPEAILPMARKISFREGIGDLLAQGLSKAARFFGPETEDLLLMAKGSPSDMHVTPIKTRALASAISPIGEDAQVQPHLDIVPARRWAKLGESAAFEESIAKYRARAERTVGDREAADPRLTAGKAALVRKDEDRTNIADMVGICSWMTSFMGLPVSDGDIARLLSLGLGGEVTPEDLRNASLRMHHLERAYLGQCGQTRRDDRLSKAYYDRIRPGGRPMPELGLNRDELERMKDDYYDLMGWDRDTGLPGREILERYGLKDVADRVTY